jgi:hypothetical protein
MMPLIGQLLGFGYTASQILSYISKKFPELTKGILNAQNQGFDPEKILKFISNKAPVNKKNQEELLNSNDAYMRNIGLHTRQERNENTAKYLKGAIGFGAGVLATAPFAKKAYDVFSGMQSGAVKPDEIIQTRPQKGTPPTRLGLPGPEIQQGKQGQPTPPTTPQGQPPIETQGQPQPLEQPPVLNEPVTPEEKAFMASEQEIQTLWDMAKSGKRAGGPADEFLKTANKLIKSGDITDYDTFKQFRKWWKTTESENKRGNPLTEFELFRHQTSSWTGQKPAKVGDQFETPKGKRATLQEMKNKVYTVAFADGSKGQFDENKLKKLSEATPKARDFANALYKAPHETEEEWDQRKTIHSAAKKAAKEIIQGKTFLDLPTPEGASKHYSTAVDVLQFMAGMPNVYNDLLDDDEKQELFEASGMTEMLRPTKLGDRPIHGAQITPNMVWNMLIAVEPKLTTMKRPMSQKKSGALKSGEMGSAEFRRQLTHNVYGILSGKNISTELSDKINKISTAVPILDKLVQSFKTKKLKETEEEMNKLADDDYFASLFTDAVEEMVKKLR